MAFRESSGDETDGCAGRPQRLDKAMTINQNRFGLLPSAPYLLLSVALPGG